MPSDPRVVIPDAFELVGDLLMIGGRRSGGHPTVIVLDLADAHARLLLVTVCGLLARRLLEPAHHHTSTRTQEAMT